MVRKYEWTAEAEGAIIEHFQARNAARGQYPKRIAPKREWQSIAADGTVTYLYTYKGEQVTMKREAYCTIVEF